MALKKISSLQGDGAEGRIVVHIPGLDARRYDHLLQEGGLDGLTSDSELVTDEETGTLLLIIRPRIADLLKLLEIISQAAQPNNDDAPMASTTSNNVIGGLHQLNVA